MCLNQEASVKTRNQILSITLLGFSLAATLSACGQAESGTSAERVEAANKAFKTAPAPACNSCGTVAGIETMKVKGEGSGMGAVAGAVAGAVIGHQIGDGHGKEAATVAGAVGGGFAGNEIEKRAKGTTYYHVTVDMETGGTRTIDVDALNGISTGSKVKVVGNNLQIAGN